MSLAVVFSLLSTLTRSLLTIGISAKRTQPRIAVKTAVPRYSDAIIGVSVSPFATITLEPPLIIRQTIGTITTQAEKPICLKVFEIETTFVHSVGSGVSAEAIPCEGTSPIVIAILQMRYVINIHAYSPKPLNGTFTNTTAVNTNKGTSE